MSSPKPPLWRRIKARFFKKVSDRRKYSRVPISVKVTNLESGSFTYYVANNISIGGMFLRADEPLMPGTRLKLQFALPDRREMEVTGMVVRVQQADPKLGIPSGMGIRFDRLADPARQSIDAFVELKT